MSEFTIRLSPEEVRQAAACGGLFLERDMKALRRNGRERDDVLLLLEAFATIGVRRALREAHERRFPFHLQDDAAIDPAIPAQTAATGGSPANGSKGHGRS